MSAQARGRQPSRVLESARTHWKAADADARRRASLPTRSSGPGKSTYSRRAAGPGRVLQEQVALGGNADDIAEAAGEAGERERPGERSRSRDRRATRRPGRVRRARRAGGRRRPQWKTEFSGTSATRLAGFGDRLLNQLGRVAEGRGPADVGQFDRGDQAIAEAWETLFQHEGKRRIGELGVETKDDAGEEDDEQEAGAATSVMARIAHGASWTQSQPVAEESVVGDQAEPEPEDQEEPGGQESVEDDEAADRAAQPVERMQHPRIGGGTRVGSGRDHVRHVVRVSSSSPLHLGERGGITRPTSTASGSTTRLRGDRPRPGAPRRSRSAPECGEFENLEEPQIRRLVPRSSTAPRSRECCRTGRCRPE